MGFLISQNGEILHELCHYHNHKTALLYCVFLGPFRLCVGIDPTGMQMRVYSFCCLSFELQQWHILGEVVVQQVVLPEAVHLPSKHIRWDDHNSFSSGLLVSGVFLSPFPLWYSPGDLAKEEQLKEESGLWLRMSFWSQPLQVPGRARGWVHSQGCAGSLLGYRSPGSSWFQAAPPHVGCISKHPAMYPFSRKSHWSTQVLSNCYGTYSS